MEYKIHIQDVDNYEDELILHFSESGDIALNWLGGDDKTQAIVGSELKFSIEVDDCEQGKYDKYFTSDEQKWVVQMYQVGVGVVAQESLIWRGYLLPESYQEPWNKAGLFFIKFSAVDGLGLLKGKEFKPEYYKNEQIVTDVIIEALNETGLGFNVYISPAIENHLKKKWHQIYIDTLKYYDEDKLPSIHKILEEIIFSMRCVLYQADGRWYIEGINKRQFISVVFDVYMPEKKYLGEATVEKSIKQVTWLATPYVTLIPPYKNITVKHKASQLELPKCVYQRQNIEWEASENTQVKSYYSTCWNWSAGHSYKAENMVGDNYVNLINYLPNENFNTNRKIDLRQKLYVLKGWRLFVKIDVELWKYDEEEIPTDEQIENWMNYAVYRITINGETEAFNYGDPKGGKFTLDFDASGSAQVEFTITAKESGFLNVELFSTWGDPEDTRAYGYKIKRLEIENLDQKKDFIYQKAVDVEATQTKEIDLPISQDISGLSKSFYLEPLRVFNPIENYYIITPYNWFTEDGNSYAVLTIRDAVLLEQFKDFTLWLMYNGNPWNVLTESEVIYNYEGGENMVIKFEGILADAVLQAGKIRIAYRRYKTASIERTDWGKWTDSIYKIEEKPYAQVVAEIESKLYSKPYIKFEGDARNSVKFNDILVVEYKGENKYFYPTNSEWIPDQRMTSLNLSEGTYNGYSFGNLPPFVYAGENQEYTFGETVTINAVAFDPDGIIVNIQWTQLEGAPSLITGDDTLNPTFSGLINPYYKFQVEVTDNSGNTATDTIEINRLTPIELDFEVTDSGSIPQPTPFPTVYWSEWTLNANPSMPFDYAVNLFYNVIFKYKLKGFIYTAKLYLNKNGQQWLWESDNRPLGPGVEIDVNEVTPGIINFRDGDDVKIRIEVTMSLETTSPTVFLTDFYSRFIINGYERANGYADITNLPIIAGLNATP